MLSPLIWYVEEYNVKQLMPNGDDLEALKVLVGRPKDRNFAARPLKARSTTFRSTHIMFQDFHKRFYSLGNACMYLTVWLKMLTMN